MIKKYFITIMIFILLVINLFGCNAKPKNNTSSELIYVSDNTSISYSSSSENAVSKVTNNNSASAVHSVSSQQQESSEQSSNNKNTTSNISENQVSESSQVQAKDGMDMIEEAIREALRKQ